MPQLRSIVCSMVGHVDHGKCVHPSTLIPLVDGSIKRIDNLWEDLSKNHKVKKIKEGEYIEINNLSLFSLNKEKNSLKHQQPQVLCRLKSPKNLIKCKTSLNSQIIVTPEHPFFILEGLNIAQKNADELKEGDHILHVRELKGNKLSHNKILDFIFDNLRDDSRWIVKIDNNLSEKIKNKIKDYKIIDIEKNIPGLFFGYSFKRKIFRIIHLIKLCNLLRINNFYKSIVLIKQSSLERTAGHKSKWIKLPKTKKELEELFYLIGCLTGDGISRKGKLFNNDDEILEKCSSILKNMNIGSKIIQGRTCKEVDFKGGKTFYYFLEKIFKFPKSQKSKTITIPEIVEISNNKLSGNYLSGYFDTDGCPEENQSQISISTASEDMAKKLPLLLLHFGCVSNYRKQIIENKIYHEFGLSGKKNLENFNDKIGFRLTRKQLKLNKILKRAVSNRKLDIFPLSQNEIKDIRVSLGFTCNELSIPYWRKYETSQNLTLDILKKFLLRIEENKEEIKSRLKTKIRKISNLHNLNYNDILNFTNDGLIKKEKNKLLITKYGEKIVELWKFILNDSLSYINKILSFNTFTNTDLCFVRVKETNKIKSDTEWVYDFTEDNTKTFVANGFVIHNTSILDRIRSTNVAAGEAGLITQCISCTNVPFEAIKILCKDFPQIKNLKIPGLLMIDTPGHASFTNLRKRGGSLADIAVLVIDINEGIKPQTLESIEILKINKTPFVIAANKLDLIPGFRKTDVHLLKNLNSQSESTLKKIDEKVYGIVGRLAELKLNSDRFDRVEDYTKNIAIMPISAKLGLGIPELLLLLTGLAQKFMEKQLNIDVNKPAKGVVLEVKEEKGLGKALDVIIYDGKIKKGDQLIIAGLEVPIELKVRNLLETSFKTKKLVSVDEVEAAATLKIVATESDEVFAGMPFEVATEKTKNKIKAQIQEEVDEVLLETDGTGVIVKADSLGSLEALISLLRENNIEIKKASLGNINKGDIAEASAEENQVFKAILAFNVKSKIDSKDVKIISHEVIYQIIDEYKEWREKETKKSELEKLKGVFRPGKFMVLPGTIFRQNNPAIFGIEILKGSISTDCPLMRDDGFSLGNVKAIQVEGESKGKVEKGKQAAISVPGITIGRHLFENSLIYTNIPEEHFRKLKEMKTFLNQDEVQLLKEIALIKRKANPLWGV